MSCPGLFFYEFLEKGSLMDWNCGSEEHSIQESEIAVNKEGCSELFSL